MLEFLIVGQIPQLNIPKSKISLSNSKINNKYKGFTANLVREAFGWDDKFMKKE